LGTLPKNRTELENAVSGFLHFQVLTRLKMAGRPALHVKRQYTGAPLGAGAIVFGDGQRFIELNDGGHVDTLGSAGRSGNPDAPLAADDNGNRGRRGEHRRMHQQSSFAVYC
jgi:hypothetical protein